MHAGPQLDVEVLVFDQVEYRINWLLWLAGDLQSCHCQDFEESWNASGPADQWRWAVEDVRLATSCVAAAPEAPVALKLSLLVEYLVLRKGEALLRRAIGLVVNAVRRDLGGGS